MEAKKHNEEALRNQKVSGVLETRSVPNMKKVVSAPVPAVPKPAVKPAEKKVAPAAEKKVVKADKKSGKLAIVLVRGLIGIRTDIKDTLFMLRLRKKHTCVVVSKDKTSLGMVFKIKDYVAYGEIDDATLKELVAKRGKKDKKYFSLSPPKGGFARKGIKTSFTRGGVLGYRGDKINNLIKRML